MTKKHIIFSFTAVLIIMGGLTACQQDDNEMDIPATDGMETQQTPEGQFVYTLDLDCPPPSFDDENTRAATSWSNGATIYLRFKNGSSWITGLAKYNSSTGLWTVEANSSIGTVTSSTTCETYYFNNPSSSSRTGASLTHSSIIYQGSGTYTHASNTAPINVTSRLNPKTWRMRFSGTVGTSITVKSNSDIGYFSQFNLSGGTWSSQSKDVSLTVQSNGYTPYIYGFFNNTSGNNTVYVTSGGYTFYRTINGSNLQAKGSGYLSIPNMDNYIDKGWRKESKYVSNCDLKTLNPVVFQDRIITKWSVGSNAALCFSVVYKYSDVSSLSDNQIVDKILNDFSSGRITADTPPSSSIIQWFYGLSSSTSYYLCTYCIDQNGDHGNLVKYFFTTKSPSAPIAELGYISSNSSNVWTNVSMRNGAGYYYITGFVEMLSEDDAYIQGYYMYNSISSYTRQSYSNTQIKWNRNGYSQFCFMTWATNYSGTFGNFDYGNYNLSSSRQLIPVNKVERLSQEDNLGYKKTIIDADTLKIPEMTTILVK